MCHSLLLNSMETANEGPRQKEYIHHFAVRQTLAGKENQQSSGNHCFQEKREEQKENCVCVCVRERAERFSHPLGFIYLFPRPLALYLSYSNSLR